VCPERAPILELRDVSFAFHGKRSSVPTIHRIDLTISPGELVCIVGPSGCGKTTLLRLMAGFLAPVVGVVLDEDAPVAGPDWRRGVVFQQAELYPWLTVVGNIGFGPKVRRIAPAERQRRTEHCLRMVGLTEFRDAHPHELSGGMQQRVALARALANEPHILLMDEPFGALDALTRERMQEELLAIWRNAGCTVVLVTHSVEEAVYLGTRVVVLSDRPATVEAEISVDFGRKAQRGEGRSVKAQPDFIQTREEILKHIWRS
jgi:ABC-type nitrate/sulfonate/bicarbonate transport system ATPase subunit